MRRFTETPTLVVLLLVLALPTAAGDWPGFRGGSPGLTGVAADGLPDRPQPLWIYEIPEGIESTAAIVGGVVFVGGLDGRLHAVDLQTGRGLWTYAAEEEIKSSPSVADGTVYFGDGAGVFHAVDAATGKPRWTFAAEAEIVSSANVTPGAVVFGSHDQFLYALGRSGELKWKVETEGYVFGMPAVYDGQVVSAGCDGFLRVISLADGKPQSEIALGAYVGASPAVAAGVVYVGTFENQVLAVDLAGGEVIWKYEDPERQFPYLSSGALSDELFVVGGRDKRVHAIERKTGKGVWRYAGRGKFDSSPVISGERAIVAGVDGEIVALDLADGKPSWSFDTGQAVTASPAIADGKLVVGTAEGQLYCFGANAESKRAGETRGNP